MKSRIFVEKQKNFTTASDKLFDDLQSRLGLRKLKSMKAYLVFDAFGLEEGDLEILKTKVISDGASDLILDKLDLEDKTYLARESLLVQFDQRAQAAMENFFVLTGREIKITCGEVFVFEGKLSDSEKLEIRKYLINPVEKREKDLSVLEADFYPESKDTPTYTGFIGLDNEELEIFRLDQGLAMSDEDLFHVQEYFRTEEKRDPTETEILVLDTYWSDHCRHTTFETDLTNIFVSEGRFKEDIKKAFQTYMDLRKETSREEKARTLMDMATIVGRYFRQEGLLDDQELSSEINACSVHVEIDNDGVKEPWLMMFKNETHNHPTEIEPFGGAGTCLGGAIRDPLSGRAYVYQAMRLTGAGDIRENFKETIPSKLPQVLISERASDGYSDYANQIGSAATYVREFYHPGFVAKRMELGAVVGAVPTENVVRQEPVPGDLVIYLGGPTGRDGVGGATGSSVEHDKETDVRASSEVQKGNPPQQANIQRLFRNPEFSKLIKKSNDFGAGGVSVAIGELADGLEINLDLVPVKYPGLSGTELAISESQERMAIVIDPSDLDKARSLAGEEDLELYEVAVVDDSNRLTITHKGQKIVDISREFLDTNGCRQNQEVEIDARGYGEDPFARALNKPETKENILENLSDLNVGLQKGLNQKFDSTVGRSSVYANYGGKYQLTEADVSVQKFPTKGFTNSASAMSSGYNQFIASYSPYLGGLYSLVEALAKLVAIGADYKGARLTNQEYFERLGTDKEAWGKPSQALLGLVEAQMEFGTPSIGGKDSMSGSFEDLHVPPTLITFAVKKVDVNDLISPEFKASANRIYLVKTHMDENYHPNFDKLKEGFDAISENIRAGKIVSAMPLKFGGISEAVAKMAYGNKLGAEIDTSESLFSLKPGSIIVEANTQLQGPFEEIGRVKDNGKLLFNGIEISLEEALKSSLSTFDKIYPVGEDKILKIKKKPEHKDAYARAFKARKPKVLIPLIPGSNGHYDLAKAFEKEGAEVKTFLVKTRNKKVLQDSYAELARLINRSDILALSGSYMNGDEPNGGGKILTNIFREPRVFEALLAAASSDKLILGLGTGFKVLLDLGLLGSDELGVKSDEIIISKNSTGKHISKIVRTKVVSARTPWMRDYQPGDVIKEALSSSEARLVISDSLAKELFDKGQVGTVYINESGRETDLSTGSYHGIESISSADGRILGKMTHPERYEEGLLINIDGDKGMNIFKSAVGFFN